MIAGKINLLGGPWNGLTGSAESFGSSVSLLDSLFSYWKLDETGTTQSRLDSSGNSVSLDVDNSADYSSGLINNSFYSAEDIDGYLVNYNSLGQNVYGASEFTISFWANCGEGTYDAQGIITIGEGFAIHCRPLDLQYNFLARTVNEQPPDSNYYISYNFGTVNLNSWDHVVVTRSLDGYLRFYVNNSLTDTVAIDGPIYSDSFGAFASSDIVLGRLVYGYPVYGSIDEFGIWTRALSAAEVDSLYNGGNGKAFNTF